MTNVKCKDAQGYIHILAQGDWVMCRHALRGPIPGDAGHTRIPAETPCLVYLITSTNLYVITIDGDRARLDLDSHFTPVGLNGMYSAVFQHLTRREALGIFERFGGRANTADNPEPPRKTREVLRSLPKHPSGCAREAGRPATNRTRDRGCGVSEVEARLDRTDQRLSVMDRRISAMARLMWQLSSAGRD